MPVCRHHFFKIQVYVLVDTDRRSSAFKRPSNIVLRWSDLTNPRADFFLFLLLLFFFFFCRHGGGGARPRPPLDPLLRTAILGISKFKIFWERDMPPDPWEAHPLDMPPDPWEARPLGSDRVALASDHYCNPSSLKSWPCPC